MIDLLTKLKHGYKYEDLLFRQNVCTSGQFVHLRRVEPIEGHRRRKFSGFAEGRVTRFFIQIPPDLKFSFKVPDQNGVTSLALHDLQLSQLKKGRDFRPLTEKPIKVFDFDFSGKSGAIPKKAEGRFAFEAVEGGEVKSVNLIRL